jgi:hypothetical protein
MTTERAPEPEDHPDGSIAGDIHTDLNPHDIPPGNPARQAVEERRAGEDDAGADDDS